MSLKGENAKAGSGLSKGAVRARGPEAASEPQQAKPRVEVQKGDLGGRDAWVAALLEVPTSCPLPADRRQHFRQTASP